MTKAEQRALEAYPPQFTKGKRYAKRVQSEKVDTHVPIRKIYLKGYEQAEKDLALTWKDIRAICDSFMDVGLESNLPGRSKEFYTAVLDHYNKREIKCLQNQKKRHWIDILMEKFTIQHSCVFNRVTSKPK